MAQFPLVVWELTDEYKKEHEEAKKKLEEISETLRKQHSSYPGELKFDSDGNPIAWICPSSPLYIHSAEEALKHAKSYGQCGWWTIEQLQQFSEGNGIVIEDAMWKLGFRRHKANPSKWSKLQAKEKHSRCPASRLQLEQYDALYQRLPNEETERLESMRVMPNDRPEMSKTFDIRVGARGMIYLALFINPFRDLIRESGIMRAEQMQRCHLAKQQNGFYLEAKNITLNHRKNNHAVYIQAKRPDSTYVEAVWPSVIDGDKIIPLAQSLSDKLK